MSSQRVQPEIVIRFPEGRRRYAPGDSVAAELTVPNFCDLDCRAAEASVLWRTVGQGDEDLHVHFFQRLTPQKSDTFDLTTPLRIESELPHSPLSYDGVNVKVCWCVRLRLFLDGYHQVTQEAPFHLGDTWTPDAPGDST